MPMIINIIFLFSTYVSILNFIFQFQIKKEIKQAKNQLTSRNDDVFADLDLI